MVLRSLRTDAAPAFIAPDEQTWTLAGDDPAARGLRPAFAPGQAQVALIAERMPGALIESVAEWLARMPTAAVVETRELPGLPGEPAALMRGAGAANHQPYDETAHVDAHSHGGHDHGGHDHHDMMAIVGDPSADGLVMEPIEFRFGPVGTPLPAGLVVDVTLDGDVVAQASIEATLRRSSEGAPVPAPPDLLAPVAWRTLLDGVAGEQSDADRWTGIAAVEVERTVSHLAWLRSFGRLLGWPPLIDRCTAALTATAGPHESLSARAGRAAPDDLAPPIEAVRDVAELVNGSRWLRLRTAGRAVVAADDVRRHGLHGPTARASGVDDDVRAEHPLYQRLGFTTVVRPEGDALARTSIRAEEAVRSLQIAEGALRAAVGWKPADAKAHTDSIVEGPRGPLRAVRSDDTWRLAAPGASEVRDVAARAMAGLEWATALVAIASFDLSPWSVDG